ncbi:MAG: FMN-binding protein [bacterium]|jgi:uncharacterized protein with FMN-binding domain
MMKKKVKIVFGALLAIVIAVYFITTGIIKNIESNLEQLADLTIANVDCSQLSDGVYTGSYKVFPVAAEVEVTVANHTIVAIELVEHNHGRGKAAEIIPSQVVAAQSLEVDAVSGATYSSKVILKAIENALIGRNK